MGSGRGCFWVRVSRFRLPGALLAVVTTAAPATAESFIVEDLGSLPR
jgi:hypothetical protein